MDISQTEDKLFQEWREKRKKRKKRKRFVCDGAVDAKEFMKSPFSILFLLKEVNDPEKNGEDWDLREFIRNGARGPTWNTVARWVIEGGHGKWVERTVRAPVKEVCPC